MVNCWLYCYFVVHCYKELLSRVVFCSYVLPWHFFFPFSGCLVVCFTMWFILTGKKKSCQQKIMAYINWWREALYPSLASHSIAKSGMFWKDLFLSFEFQHSNTSECCFHDFTICLVLVRQVWYVQDVWNHKMKNPRHIYSTARQNTELKHWKLWNGDYSGKR